MKDDGRAAFPCPTGSDGGVYQVGLTMRDYFAAAAMQGAMANERLLPSTKDELTHLAMRVYEMADAMIAERDKP